MIRFSPDVIYFKPRGIPLRYLTEVVLNSDEIEAVRLYDAEGKDQKNAAVKMHVSQPTFARILKVAHRKIGDALITGKAIRIITSRS